MTIDATQIRSIAARLGMFDSPGTVMAAKARERVSTLTESERKDLLERGMEIIKRGKKRRMKRHVPVYRRSYPKTEQGQREYNREYHRVYRKLQGFKRIGNKVPIKRKDYPRGVGGRKQYKHDYGVVWRAIEESYQKGNVLFAIADERRKAKERQKKQTRNLFQMIAVNQNLVKQAK